MNRNDLAEAARTLDAIADQVEHGLLEANVRELRYLRGAAIALHVAATPGARDS